MKHKKDVQQGTLALMVPKTLDVLGPLHGYRIARRIEQSQTTTIIAHFFKVKAENLA